MLEVRASLFIDNTLNLYSLRILVLDILKPT